MADEGLFIQPVFTVAGIAVTSTVIVTWGIMAMLAITAWAASRRLTLEPGPFQTAVEGVVEAIDEAVTAVAPGNAGPIIPFVGTLWIFLVTANLTGLIPGLHSPTRDLSATSGLAFLVFLSTHWYGVRIEGWKSYLRHYLTPVPILLPFHVVSEITRIVALAVRLFGNIMSLELTALLVLLVAGFLAPVPILMLHIVEALVQAYIFGMLALIYVAGGVQSQQLRQQKGV